MSVVVGGVVLIGVDALVESALRAAVDCSVVTVSGSGEWVAGAAVRVTAAVSRGEIRGPLVVVADGKSWMRLPEFAAAQRASQRLVIAYVLIEPRGAMRTSHDWPDAPITVVSADTETQRIAGLRGWQLATEVIGAVCGAIDQI